MVDFVSVYSNVGTRFGLVDLEHPGGHHGQDFRLPNGGGSVIPAYEECVVVESGTEVTRGFTAILGWYVVAKSTQDGKYMGWAHLRRGTRPAVGAVLKPGDQVGLAANGPRPATNLSPAVAGINYPGTAWTAPHIHTTLSTTIPGIFAGPTLDPLPRIQAALVSTAGAEKFTPIGTPAPIKKDEDDMPLTADDVTLILGTRIKVRGGKATCTVQEALSAAFDVYDGTYKAAEIAGGRPLAALLVEAQQAVTRKVARQFPGESKPREVEQIQDNADTNTLVRQLVARPADGVDVDELADAIAAKLPAGQPVDVAGIVRAELARVFVAAQP